MLIALASQNRQSLTAHAGKCRHFFVLDTDRDAGFSSLELEPGQMLSVWGGEGWHPLDGFDVVVAASMGQGLAARLTARGIRACASAERDLREVIVQIRERRLPELALRPPSGRGECGR